MLNSAFAVTPSQQPKSLSDIDIARLDSELMRLSEVNLASPPLVPSTLFLLTAFRERYVKWREEHRAYSHFFLTMTQLLQIKQRRREFQKLVELCPDTDGWHYAIDRLIEAAWHAHESTRDRFGS